jgi:hypothetical protein
MTDNNNKRIYPTSGINDKELSKVAGGSGVVNSGPDLKRATYNGQINPSNSGAMPRDHSGDLGHIKK